LRPGQQVLEVDTGSEEGPLQIILDANKSPVEQAQQMFQRAAKMERAATVIPLRRARLLQDLEFVEQMEHDLALAQNQPEIAGVVEELRRARLLTETKQKESKQSATRKSQPGQRGHGGVLRFTTQDGYEILVGRNARQNETITFDLARPDDLWLHV